MYYVTSDNGNITSLLILKIEYEDYSNFTIPFNKSKRLKIYTFKVINNEYYEYLGSKSDNKELVLVKRRND